MSKYKIGSFDEMFEKALDGISAAADMVEMGHTSGDPRISDLAMKTANLSVQGAQVFATLALARAEKDSIEYFEARNPKPRPRPTLGNVTPIVPKKEF